MQEHTWSGRTVVKYTLMQLPGLAAFVLILVLLRHWLLIPLWTLWILIPLWIVKDAILFPFVWKAYDDTAPSMIGSKGRTTERLAPSGHVRVQGEIWNAETINNTQPVEKGETVKVINIRGLTLVVEPAGTENE